MPPRAGAGAASPQGASRSRQVGTRPGRTSVSLTERRGTTTERKPRRPDSETPASLDDLSARKRNAARACSASSTPPHLKVSEVSRVQRNRAACDGSRFSRPQSPRRPLGVLVLAFGSPLIINDGPNIENVNPPRVRCLQPRATKKPRHTLARAFCCPGRAPTSTTDQYCHAPQVASFWNPGSLDVSWLTARVVYSLALQGSKNTGMDVDVILVGTQSNCRRGYS